MILTQTDLVHNLGVLLNSQLLLEEQMAVLARRVFAQLCIVHHLCPFFNNEALLTVTCTLVTPRMDYYDDVYMRLPLKRYLKLHLVQSVTEWTVMYVSRRADITVLFQLAASLL